jgi:hypothetical protein
MYGEKDCQMKHYLFLLYSDPPSGSPDDVKERSGSRGTSSLISSIKK